MQRAGLVKAFKVKPRPVERPWGGSRLRSFRGFGPGSTPLGESWEVCGDSLWEGLTLDEWTRQQGTSFVGSWCERPELGFPLLTKWLDCQQWLSVQVHPDDDLALELHGPGHFGKSEAWYFHEVAPEAQVIHGWSGGVSTPLPRGAEWLQHLRRFKPCQGEWAYTSPGTVHALGPGLLVFEVQQCSDLTYRLYDWERLGLDGQPRELHLLQGEKALRLSPQPAVLEDVPGLLGEVKVKCPYFVVEEVSGSRNWSTQGESVELVTSLDQGARLGDLQLAPGDSAVIPASAGEQAWQGFGKWLRVRLLPLGRKSAS